MADRVAATAGIDIEVLGTSDLLLRDAEGNPHRIMQADQIVYTHPVRMRPLGHAIEVDADELPVRTRSRHVRSDHRRGRAMVDLPVREVVQVAAKCQDEDDFIRRIILAPVE